MIENYFDKASNYVKKIFSINVIFFDAMSRGYRNNHENNICDQIGKMD